jgi:hypothetical protein
MLTSVLEAVALVVALVALWLSAEVTARLCQGLEAADLDAARRPSLAKVEPLTTR